MRILYEISNLGLGHIDPKCRTGIFRYVESLLEQLTISTEINCKLTSYTHIHDAIFTEQYLAAEKPEWSHKFLNNHNGNLISTKYYLKILDSIHQNKSRDIVNRAKRKSQALFLNFLTVLYRYSEISESFDIYHSFYNPFPAKSKIKAKARIITIYDMIPLILPEYFHQGFQKEFSKILKSLDLNQDWSVCISEATKKDFCAYSKMPKERVFVTPLAANPKFYPESDLSIIKKTCQKYKIPLGKYILGLSTLEPRKNTAFLVKCFYKLLLEKAVEDTYLVLAGAKGWLFDDIFLIANTQPDLLNKIIFTGYIQDSDLSAIYSGATCFIYPSFYEGFGLPPLEAMQCGVPVITSNTSSLPEVVGNAGIMIDPKDEDALCQAMFNLLTDTSLRENLKQKSLERAKLFSWRKCADETIKIYHQILQLS